MTGRKFLKGQIILGFLILFLFTLSLALWPPQLISPPQQGHQAFNLMGNALGEKGEIILNKEQVNGLLKKAADGEQKIATLPMKNIEIDMKEDQMILHIPMDYRGLSVLLTCYGSLDFQNPHLYYQPNKVMVGKLPIPKSFLLKTLKKHKDANMTVEQGQIKIHKKIFPFSISYMGIQGEELHISLDQEGKIQWALQFLDLEEKEKERVKKILENVLEDLEQIKEILIENNQKDVIDRIQRSIENMILYPEHHPISFDPGRRT